MKSSLLVKYQLRSTAAQAETKLDAVSPYVIVPAYQFTCHLLFLPKRDTKMQENKFRLARLLINYAELRTGNFASKNVARGINKWKQICRWRESTSNSFSTDAVSLAILPFARSLFNLQILRLCLSARSNTFLTRITSATLSAFISSNTRLFTLLFRISNPLIVTHQ